MPLLIFVAGFQFSVFNKPMQMLRGGRISSRVLSSTSYPKTKNLITHFPSLSTLG